MFKGDDIKTERKVSLFFSPLVYLPCIAVLSLFFISLHGLEAAFRNCEIKVKYGCFGANYWHRFQKSRYIFFYIWIVLTYSDDNASATFCSKVWRLFRHLCTSVQFLQCSNLTLFWSLLCCTPVFLWGISLMLRESKHELKSSFFELVNVLTVVKTNQSGRNKRFNIKTLRYCVKTIF